MSKVLMPEEIEAIRERDKTRTQGKWRVVQKGNTVKSYAVEGICSGISPKTTNAEFIAGCSEDVSNLLYTLDALLYTLDAYELHVKIQDGLIETQARRIKELEKE